ncbi:CRISPR-associated protein, Cse3 family [Hydrogenimonas sp.]|nr:CRISPR-associated protein, Cse3 family [Hydrogenimonas sp.]
MGGFKTYPPEKLGRVLFRLEPERRERFANLLVQSLREPDWNHLPRHSVQVETKYYNPQFRKGELLTFRLRANPVVTRNKKRYGLIRESDQRQWLLRKKIGADWQIQNIIDEGRIIGKREEKSLEFKSVRYEGYLIVSDPEKLIRSCLEGIGPAKGFGFGLLSLARMQ